VSQRSKVVAGAAGKVAVLGAAGGIGQPLSMLVKMLPHVKELALYDIQGTPGVAADLSHCNTACKVTGHVGEEELHAALEGCELVIIPAGVPRKPGMTRDDLFNINAGIVKSLATASAEVCPNAILNIISNPVNSTVPICNEVYKAKGIQGASSRILGVTTLDIVRSNTFLAEACGLDVDEVDVPVVGGHAGITILPLLSQMRPKTSLSEDKIKELTVRIQNAGTEVVEAKAGAGSATLSMAYAAARFAESCLRGLQGDKVYECAYLESPLVPGTPYFASKVQLGPNGVEDIFAVGEVTQYEQEGIDTLIPELNKSIEKGVQFAKE
jgi:malate dehydrogenase